MAFLYLFIFLISQILLLYQNIVPFPLRQLSMPWAGFFFGYFQSHGAMNTEHCPWPSRCLVKHVKSEGHLLSSGNVLRLPRAYTELTFFKLLHTLLFAMCGWLWAQVQGLASSKHVVVLWCRTGGVGDRPDLEECLKICVTRNGSCMQQWWHCWYSCLCYCFWNGPEVLDSESTISAPLSPWVISNQSGLFCFLTYIIALFKHQAPSIFTEMKLFGSLGPDF